MDRTLLRRTKLKRDKKLKKSKSRRQEEAEESAAVSNPQSQSQSQSQQQLPSVPSNPIVPSPNLDDVITDEITVKKAERGAPLPLTGAAGVEPVASVTGTAGAAPAGAQVEQTEGGTEGEEDGVQTVSQRELEEVKREVEEHADRSRKTKKKRSGNGDYGAAYQELYTQLCMRLLHPIYRYFQALYQKVGGNHKAFRRKLEGIQDWGPMELGKRVKEIKRVFPDTESYFKYAYAANAMLMSVVVQEDEDSTDVEIEVPKFDQFVHRSYLESARYVYDNAGVLDPSISDDKKLRIREDLFSCYSKAIATALRMMVPLSAIAPGTASVSATGEETYSDEEDESEEASEEEEEDDESDEEEDEEDDDEDEESGSGSEDEDDDDDEDEESSELDSEDEDEPQSYGPGKKKRVHFSRRDLEDDDDGYRQSRW